MRFLVAICLIAALPLAAGAADLQFRGADVQYVTADPVAQVKASAGAPTKVMLNFHVLEGYHVNSNKPRSEFLIPTKLKLSPPLGIRVAQLTYPAGKDFSLSFSPAETLNVYTGDFSIQATLEPAPAALAGAYHVSGELDYQACSDRACFPPKKLPVSFEVEVAK